MDDAFRWPSTWMPIQQQGKQLESELAKEVGLGHPLKGIRVRAIAVSCSSDDVLFELLDGPRKYAIVHLTWRGLAEPDASWPATQFFDRLQDALPDPS
ncbi:MAG: hypothetical protein J0M17_10980 [Planctomycetes bacterium]|nr:hypothetical protein [Planctomycetota bacterium]